MTIKDITCKERFLEWAMTYKKQYGTLIENRKHVSDVCLKYVYYFYNKESEFLVKYPDVEKRKEACLKEALESSKPGKVVLNQLKAALFDVADKDVSFFIVEYCRLQRSRIWDMIVANEQAFFEYNKLLLAPITEEGNDLLKGAELKGKLMKEMESIDERLTHYYEMLFPHSKSIEVDIKPISPESIAMEGI